MNMKKMTAVAALFAFFLAIALIPAKAVNAEDYIPANFNQPITVNKGEYKEYSINVTPGMYLYFESSVRDAHIVNTLAGLDYTKKVETVETDDYWFQDSDAYAYIADGVFYIKKATTLYFEPRLNGTVYKEVGEAPTTGTITLKDATQYLAPTQTKANSYGNNVYQFTPKLSGVYSFTAKTADGKLGYGDVSVKTFDGNKFKEVRMSSDPAYAYTYGYNGSTVTLTMWAGVTYYIGAYAYNYVEYTYKDSDGDECEDSYNLDNGYVLSISQSPTVAVPKVTISKATSPKTKTAKVTWKKAAGVGGYEVSYSTNKKMTGAKTVLVSNKAAAKTIAKLAKKKVYYVRVRAYKTVEGNKYFGAYSKTLKVKTK